MFNTNIQSGKINNFLNINEYAWIYAFNNEILRENCNNKKKKDK